MYYFDDEEKVAKLEVILNEWKGTPFRHRCGVKQMGCDCVHFAVKVFEEFGLLELKKGMIPNYARDWHMHNTRELLTEAIFKYLDVEQVDLTALRNGDIVLSHYGHAASHAGIYFNDHIFQSVTKIGVVSIHINDKKFSKQMKFAYRIKA